MLILVGWFLCVFLVALELYNSLPLLNMHKIDGVDTNTRRMYWTIYDWT